MGRRNELAGEDGKMITPLMKCGHSANAVTSDGKPCCAICFGISGGLNLIVDDNPPDLSKRKARCSYYGTRPTGRNHSSNYGCHRGETCMCEQPSKTNLPFFEHKPDKDYDEFYCGCWGWD